MGDYDVAQVCLNGHVANSYSVRHPQCNIAFCETCGEPTITRCEKCTAPIRGNYYVEGVFGADHYTPPAFCGACGAAFPWTERGIQAAIELAVESGDLSVDEQKQFRDSVQEIARDSPRAPVAGSRVARLLAKMGKGTANAVRDILINVASEAAKKMIWPGK